MKISIERNGSAVVVRPQDAHLGADSADEFTARVEKEIEGHGSRLAVDLSKVDFVDSSGLGALVGLLKSVRPEGDLVLFGIRPGVKEILRLTHLDAVFPCEDSEDAAIAALPQSS